MKKTIILLSAVALVFAACQKEEQGSVRSGLELTATVEQQEGGSATKTYLDGTQVKWSDGDQVNVFTSTSDKITLTLSEGAGTTSGTFITEESYTGTPECAIYPASENNSISEGAITFTLPATQNYVEGSFDNGANIAVGTVSGGNIEYKNVCGVLKLQLKGAYKVSKIEIRGNNGEKLNGSYTVDPSTYDMTCVTTSDDDERVITLKCPAEGVQLDPVNPTEFYFVIPAGAFGEEGHGGFTAKVYDLTGDDFYATVSTSKTENIINRSNIRRMEAIGLSRINHINYKELSFLANTSTGTVAPFIDTEYSPKAASEYIIDFNFNSIGSQFRPFGSNGHNTLTKQGLGIYITSDHIIGYWITNGTLGSCWISVNRYWTTDRCIVAFSNSHLKLNDELIATPSGKGREITDSENNPNLYIFRTNDPSSFFPADMNLYSFIVKEGDVIKRYMIPCINQSDVLGLYDLVNSKFYQSANTDESAVSFVAGTTIE